MKLPELLAINPGATEKVKLIRTLHPHRVSLLISLDAISTAQGDFLIDEGLEFDDWIRIYYPNGENGIYRATSPEYDYDNGTVSINFNHGSSTLAYDIVPIGDTKDSNGISQPTRWTKALRTALTDALAYQSVAYWQIGVTEINPDIAVDVDYPNLLDFINEIMRQIPNAYIDYNQDSFPWTLNVRQKPSNVTAEGRLSRNVTSAKVRYDDSDLCTRVWCDALTEKHLDSPNISVYGIRAHNYYLSDTLEQSFIRAACQRYIDNRDEPLVTITVDGADFSELTGVPLDRFKLGALYRLEIAKYNRTFSEQIREIRYADIIQQHRKLSMTLGNHTEDLSSLLAGNRKANATGAAERAKAKNIVSHVYEDLVKVNVTTRNNVDEILTAAGLQWADDEKSVMLFATQEWQTGEHAGKSIGAEFKVAADNAYGTAHNEITGLAGIVDVVDDKASMAVGRYVVDDSKIHTVTQLPATGTEGHCYIVTNGGHTDAYVYSDGEFKYAKLIEDSKGKRAVFVRAGDIAIAINESGDTEAHIDAAKVILGQYTLTADDLADWAINNNQHGVFAKYIISKSITVGSITVNDAADVDGLRVSTIAQFGDTANKQVIVNGNTGVMQIQNELDINSTGKLSIIGTNANEHYDLDYSTLRTMIRSASLSSDGKTLTLTPFSGSAINFSKATTLEADVSSGNGKFTITAYQTNNRRKTEVAHHDVRLGGSYGSSWTTLDITTGGNPTIVENSGTKYLSVPVKLQQLTGAYSQPADVGTDKIYYGLSLVMEKKTGTNKITSNGTYAPSGNFIGFSEVEIDVQSGMTATGLEIDYQNHQIKVSSTSTLQNATITCAVGTPTYNQSNHTYSCDGMALANGTRIATDTSPASGTQAFDDGHDDGGATANVSRAAITEQDIPAGSIPVTLDYDAYYSITPTYTNSSGNVVPVTENAQYIKTRPDRYNAGQNSVTITKGNWSNGQIQFTKSAGTASTQSVNLDADDPSWSGNVATVAIYDGDPGGTGVSTGYSVTVNATERYNAGWDYAITNKIANATPASKALSFGESVTANVVGVKSDGTLSQLCWATFTAPSPSTPVISLPSALPNSPTSSSEALRYDNIPISASADGLSASANLSLGAGLFYNGTTQNYCMNLYSSTNQSGNVIGRISIQQLLDNQWIAGAQSVINAGGPYTAGPGEYTLNQYVTTLTVTGSSSGDIDIPSSDIYTSDRSRGTPLTTLRTRFYEAKDDSDYVMFHVNCSCGADKWYYMEP